MKLTRELKVAACVYVAALAAYAGTAGPRLRSHSSDIHFVYQAQMFLEHRLDLGHPPPNMNDWAEVDYLLLKDGRTVAGTFLRDWPSHFHELGGKVETIAPQDIVRRSPKYYVSFPPFPAVLFMPLVALFGLATNDVLATVVLAALGPTLLFLVLRRLSARGDSQRSEREDLALTALFGVGTVYYYASVLGQVWYTAHIVATVLTGLFVLASLEARYPVAAGLCLGALVLTRPQMGFWGIFFLHELWRAVRAAPAAGASLASVDRQAQRRLVVDKMVRVGLPVVLFAVAGAAFNYARFGSPTEFGHYYLNVRWTERIQRYGLFNIAFLSRNLTVAFTLLPKLLGHAPFVQVSWHGMSMLLTTPALIYLVWPRRRGSLHTALWLVVLPIALLSFLYQNDGWVQFGFRFSIDYLFALMMLLSIGGRPLSRAFYALIAWSIAVNLFGAITFGRMWQFYHNGFFPIGPAEL